MAHRHLCEFVIEITDPNRVSLHISGHPTMIDQILTSLANVLAAALRVLGFPGEVLLSVIAWIAPQAAKILTFGTGRPVVVFVLALIGWTIIVIVGLIVSKACRAVAWQIAAMCRTAVWHVKMYMGSLKTRLLWKYREYFPHKTDQTESVSQDQFDDMDIAVLASLSRSGPGAASSAPQLAHKYKLRLSQIQDRIDRLSENQMVRPASDSKGGHDKYQVTDSGMAFIAMCQRNAAIRANQVPAAITD